MAIRVCVFCGQAPKQKNREHVVPHWLLALTGDPNRKTYLGRNWSHPDLPLRVYSFDSFAFPACESCNHLHSRLESDAKRVLTALLELSAVSGDDLGILLDWFDKVRVGLWLGLLYLNGLI